MSKIVEYNYSENLFNDHASKIKYVRLRGLSTYNEAGVLGSGSTITNLFIASDHFLPKPLLTLSGNTISKRWAISGKFNTDLTDSQYDIMVAGMLVDEVELQTSPLTPTEIALFENDYSDPPTNKSYERLIINGAIPEVQVKYEIYNEGYTGTYKIFGTRADDLGTVRSWSVTGVANPADSTVAPADVNRNIAVVTKTPVRLKNSLLVDYPLASVSP
jgi:hypothetical protein